MWVIEREDMGLLDILNGMQNGPRGRSQPTGGSGGGMSPIMMALLGLLAYKALKGSGRQPTGPGGARQPTSTPSITPSSSAGASSPSGGLSDILGGLLGGRPRGAPAGASPTSNPGGSFADMIPGGLGGVFGGAAAGSLLSGGLSNLLKEFQQSGYGHTAQSWIGTGPNQDIAPKDLAHALGSDTLDALSQQTGLGREDLLSGLRQHLPDLIDQLTPNGRLPTEEEASRML
jgi:uncharacterized protein YidB (DUF937 family)